MHLILLCGFLSALPAMAYCSLRVSVRDFNGQPPPVSVTVEEDGGRTSIKETEQGVAEFCDLGINPVTVTVRKSGCRDVVVRNFPLEWGETRDLWVGYDSRTCRGETLPIPTCSLLLRFVTTESEPIKGVVFESTTKFAGNPVSDSYGRLFIMWPLRSELTGTASKKGLNPANISLLCEPRNYRTERVVLMK